MLTLNQLICGYPDGFKTHALTLSISEGESVGIVGPNGSGKTTFLKTILGVLKAIEGTYDWKEKYRFGYLPQAGNLNQILPITVSELLTAADPNPFLGLEEMGDPFRISDLINNNFQKLSGGQKQRVLMTRTFLAAPEILLLDEPNNHIDQATQKSFWDFVHQQKHVRGIFVIDHNLTNLKANVERVISLEDE